MRRRCRREREAEVAFDINVPRITVPAGRRMRVLWVLGAVLLVLLVTYNSFTTYVRPGEAEIKQSRYGSGIDPDVYTTGLHYVGPGQTMYRFPLTVQVLELSNSRSEASEDLEGHKVAPGVNIQTSEGYNVQVEASVLYRISDPLKVMQTIWRDRTFETSAVVPRGEAEVKKLEAEAELYRRRKAGDGDLLVKLAEAQGTELENQALRGVGSENMVGLRMADALRNTRVIVLPTDGEGGMNPLDLKTLLKRFDVKERPFASSRYCRSRRCAGPSTALTLLRWACLPAGSRFPVKPACSCRPICPAPVT